MLHPCRKHITCCIPVFRLHVHVHKACYNNSQIYIYKVVRHLHLLRKERCYNTIRPADGARDWTSTVVIQEVM